MYKRNIWNFTSYLPEKESKFLNSIHDICPKMPEFYIRGGDIWSTNKKVVLARIEPPKWIFRGKLHLGPQWVLRPQSFIRARDWSWKCKIWLKIQRVSHYNFGASGSIPTKHFPYDVPRGTGHNIGITFGRPAPKNLEGRIMSKIQRDFWQLSTLIANMSGMTPDIQNRKEM